MTRFGWLVTGGIVLLGALIAGLLLWSHKNATPAPTDTSVATSTAEIDPSTLSIYTSGQYGLSFFYPSSATLTDEFSATSSANLPWREQGTGPGILIARISMPAGEVRIGFSSSTKEVENCLKASSAEKTLSSFSNGSTTWSRFAFDNIGTDDEQHITSYRAVHDHACFALEIYIPFSPPSEPSSTTPAFSPEDIVKSFTFAGV